MQCNHEKTEIILTPELKHYGKMVCSECKKFIKWVSNPDKLSYKEQCAYLLDDALHKMPNNNFVKSLSEQFTNKLALSPKQLEVLKRMLEDKGVKMDKYKQYELEKKKLQQTCKTSQEYEEKIRKIIEKLGI